MVYRDTRNMPHMKKDRNMEIVRLRDKGLTWKEIAVKLEITRQRAQKVYQKWKDFDK